MPYGLLPFQFRRTAGVNASYLVVSEGGEHAFLSPDQFFESVTGTLDTTSKLYGDLVSRHILREGNDKSYLPIISAQVRSRFSPALTGVALHIVVVTLRCDHGCPYCQVSRQTCSKSDFDLSLELVPHVVDRIFESKSPTLTVEFQGGESLLAFNVIEAVVSSVERRNKFEGRDIRFVIASTLHHLSEEILDFCQAHDVYLSTSLDGPKALHDHNRPLKGASSYDRTVAGIQRAKSRLGSSHVSALTTLTRESLRFPREIVNEYVARGFHSIALRPLAPYGFAVKSSRQIGYSTEEFLDFYRTALDYIIELNSTGTMIEESYLRLLAQRVLSPAPTHYVDLMGLAGAGTAALVYNYDGGVYISDEARMLAEMGIDELKLGHVSEPLTPFLQTGPFDAIGDDMLMLSDAGCADCAYQAFCGANPVERHYLRRKQRETRISGPFCRRHLALFDYLFSLLREPGSETMRIIESWVYPPRVTQQASA